MVWLVSTLNVFLIEREKNSTKNEENEREKREVHPSVPDFSGVYRNASKYLFQCA